MFWGRELRMEVEMRGVLWCVFGQGECSCGYGYGDITHRK